MYTPPRLAPHPERSTRTSNRVAPTSAMAGRGRLVGVRPFKVTRPPRGRLQLSAVDLIGRQAAVGHAPRLQNVGVLAIADHGEQRRLDCVAQRGVVLRDADALN